MRLDITLDMISADVGDPRSGKPTQATIAFRLAFESPSPDLAQKVANELVSLYLNENIKSRTEAAAETSTFLTDEAENLRQRVAQFEADLAAFRAENLQNRPELENITRDIINRTELELNSAEQRLYAAQEQEIYLEAELQKVEPTVIGDTPVEVGAMQRLMDVEAQLAAAEAAYGERHPDIRRLRKQAEAMRAEIEPEEARDLFERQLSAARQRLAALLKTYAIDHPDVQVARELASNLEIKLAAVPDPGEVDPDNPAYINLASRLQAARAEIRTLGDKREILIAKVAEYTDNLLRTPDIEAEYRAIQREYETALLKYQEITAKQIEARLSESLESENKGERFTLIEPPLRPEQPAAPNRLAILLVGAFLSLTGGFGSVGMAEAMDTRVRGRRGVQGLLAVPPLAVIPYIYGNESVIERHRSTLVVVGIAVLVAIIGLLAIHFLWKPLDVIWFILLRKTGL